MRRWCDGFCGEVTAVARVGAVVVRAGRRVGDRSARVRPPVGRSVVLSAPTKRLICAPLRRPVLRGLLLFLVRHCGGGLRNAATSAAGDRIAACWVLTVVRPAAFPPGARPGKLRSQLGVRPAELCGISNGVRKIGQTVSEGNGMRQYIRHIRSSSRWMCSQPVTPVARASVYGCSRRASTSLQGWFFVTRALTVAGAETYLLAGLTNGVRNIGCRE